MDEFAGLKRKSKKKAVDVSAIQLEGAAPAAAADEAPTSVAQAATPADDAVRPLEADADLTLTAESRASSP